MAKTQRCPGCDTRGMSPFQAMIVGLELGVQVGRLGYKMLCDEHHLMLADAVNGIKAKLRGLRASESAVKH
jgi:hypothetical protein